MNIISMLAFGYLFQMLMGRGGQEAAQGQVAKNATDAGSRHIPTDFSGAKLYQDEDDIDVSAARVGDAETTPQETQANAMSDTQDRTMEASLPADGKTHVKILYCSG